VQGRVVVLTRNPIAEAIETVAATAGRKVVVVEQDDDGRGVAALAEASRPASQPSSWRCAAEQRSSATNQLVNQPLGSGGDLPSCIDAPADEEEQYNSLNRPRACCADTHDERNGHHGQHEDEQHSGHPDNGDHPCDGTPGAVLGIALSAA
jgi:hypothetical protein